MKSSTTGATAFKATRQALSQPRSEQQATLRTRLIDWILEMRKTDETYARYALKQYAEIVPFLDLVAGVREAMKHD